MTRSSGDIIPLFIQVGVVRMRLASRRIERLPSHATMWPRSYIHRPTRQISRRYCSSSLPGTSGVESVATWRTLSSAEGRFEPNRSMNIMQLLAQRVRRVGQKAKSKLCVNAAQLQRGGHAVNRQHISRDPVVYLVRFGVTNDFVERAFHNVQQPLVHFAFPPEKTLPVLNPFEIADGNATGVAENIRHGKDSFCINHRIGLPGGGAVGALAKNLALHLVSVLLGDLVFDGRGD